VTPAAQNSAQRGFEPRSESQLKNTDEKLPAHTLLYAAVGLIDATPPALQGQLHFAIEIIHLTEYATNPAQFSGWAVVSNTCLS
jgi:hypothetical protein